MHVSIAAEGSLVALANFCQTAHQIGNIRWVGWSIEAACKCDKCPCLVCQYINELFNYVTPLYPLQIMSCFSAYQFTGLSETSMGHILHNLCIGHSFVLKIENFYMETFMHWRHDQEHHTVIESSKLSTYWCTFSKRPNVCHKSSKCKGSNLIFLVSALLLSSMLSSLKPIQWSEWRTLWYTTTWMQTMLDNRQRLNRQ